MGKANPPIGGNDFEFSGFDESDLDDSGLDCPENIKRYREFLEAQSRAKAVFDELTTGLPDPDFENPERGQALYVMHIERLNSLIKSNLDASSLWEFVFLAGDMRETFRAKHRARLKVEKDPRQAEKAQVRACWEMWRDEPSRYKSKAEFALDMLSKFESLKSQRVIERWCLAWESEPF
jgi:hypothetical protein